METKVIFFTLMDVLIDKNTSVQRFAEKQFDRYTLGKADIDKTTYVNRFTALYHSGMSVDKLLEKLTEELNIKHVPYSLLVKDFHNKYVENTCGPRGYYELLDTLNNSYEINILGIGEEKIIYQNLKALRIDDLIENLYTFDSEISKVELQRTILDSIDGRFNTRECLYIGTRALVIEAFNELKIDSLFYISSEKNSLKLNENISKNLFPEIIENSPAESSEDIHAFIETLK